MKIGRLYPCRTRLYVAGILVAGVDIALFHFLYGQARSLAFAHMVSFLVAATIAFPLLFAPQGADNKIKAPNLAGALGVAILVLFLRGGFLASLIEVVSLPIVEAQIISAMLSAALLCAGYLSIIHYRPAADPSDKVNWEDFCIALGIYSVLLRLFYLGATDLIFEEAYYWNYAKHLDIGYLDHPPMVAWTIKLFISLLGNTEFGVRAGAFLFWFVTAFYTYRLTREIFGRAIASRAFVLVAILPVYFFGGLFISPDAPLMAFWSMATYYAHRALAADDKRAWLGLGIAVGLGAISKYSIALLGLAIVLFVLGNRESRKWLSRPEPYVAVTIALLLFSPVIIWNMQNDWSSLAFQSQGRLASKYSFSLPRIIGNVLVLLTPTGIFSIAAIMLCRKSLPIPAASGGELSAGELARSYRLLPWLTLFPVAVFALLSLFRASKLNWTGPTWIAMLPFVALLVTPTHDFRTQKLLQWCQRLWPATLIICLIIYGAFFHYLSLGLPGVPYPKNQHLIGWQGFGRDIEALVTRLERETGQEILVVGMDRNRIASGLAYYRTRAIGISKPDGVVSRDPTLLTASEHLFDGVGLMYERWFPAEKQNGRTMLLICADKASLDSSRVRSHVTEMDEINDIEIRKNGRSAGHYYYRLVKGYRAIPSSSADESAAREPID